MKKLLRSVMFASTLLIAGKAVSDIVCYEYMEIRGNDQSVGVHYLTDYTPNGNTVIKAKFASSSNAFSGANQFLYCARSGTDFSNPHFSFAPNVNGKQRFYYGKNYYEDPENTFVKDQDYELLVKDGKAHITDLSTSVTYEIGPGLQSFTMNCKIALFQSYSDNSYGGWNNSFHGRFYYLEIYEVDENGEEVLKHRYVPCRDEGVVKLYDDIPESKGTCTLASESGGKAIIDEDVAIIKTISTGSYVVTESGTATLPQPSSNTQLVNHAPEFVFDQCGDIVSKDNAHTFTSFTSGDGAGTFFKGGWWDFGGGYFWGDSVNHSNRITEFSDGAVVTNVTSVVVAGASGANNLMKLTGSSSLYVKGIRLGLSNNGGQKSSVVVENGSLLSVSGALSFSAASASNPGFHPSGNNLSVIGAGSRLVVSGLTLLGNNGDGNRPGANSLLVYDEASATLDEIIVGTTKSNTGYSESNKVVFGSCAHVTLTSLCLKSGNNALGGNLVEISDGAIVTNSGSVAFGFANVNTELGNKLVVSNAMFHTVGTIKVDGGGNDVVLAGTSPKMSVGGKMEFLGNGTSKLVFALPSSVYDAGVGNAENPLLKCDGGFSLSGSSAIHFENAKAFAKSHTASGSYVLIDSTELNITDEQIAAACASLPANMALEKTGTKLILRVRISGLFIVIR